MKMRCAIWGLAIMLMLFGWMDSGRAQSTSYWSNADSGTWLWNDAANWTPGIPTSTTTRVYWTNNAATPYTIQLTGPATSGLTRVTSDKVVFDLNGHRWDAPDSGSVADYGGGNPAVSHWLGGAAGEVCEVVFSSSAAGENFVKLNSGLQHGWRWGNGTSASIIQVTTNLGYGVVVQVPPNGGPNGARVIIRGPGSEVRNPAANYAGITLGNVQVVDGGYLNFGHCYAATLTGNTTVDQATMRLYTRAGGATFIGSVQAGQVLLTNQAVWVSGNTIQVGYNLAKGSMIVDDSTFSGQNIRLGQGARYGETVVRNGGRLVLTNGYIQINPGPTAVLTNLFSIDNGMIDLAATTSGCAITNDGLMRASGTIRCVGAPAKVCNRSRLEIGSGQGLLTLTNAILENTASGTLVFSFQADGGDAIRIDDGTATIGGTSRFATVSFTPQRGADQRWVFVEADNIAYSASDNMDALMGSFGLVPGSDYVFGVKNLGDRQALQLWIKPPGGSMIMVR